MVEKIKGAMRLVALSRAALAAGLVPGLTLADARARIPGLWVEESDPRADAALLDAVADDCDRITPVVMVDPPDGLTLDITGCEHLFGGEADLRRRVLLRLHKAGLHARAAIACGPDAARALARHGRIAIVAPGREAEAVRALPLAALGLAPKDMTAIRRAGLRTVGDVAGRPSELFAARFGEAMTLSLRRVQNLAPAPLVPRRIVPMLRVERRFAEPIGRAEDVEAAIADLAQEACTRLYERREGGRAFEAGFFRADGAVRRIRVETGRPVRQPATLLRLFREKLDAVADPVDPGFGFDQIGLAVLAADPLGPAQPGLDGRACEDDAISELADRLGARFGMERVVRFLPQDTHNPDRAAREASAVFNPMTSASWPATEAGEPPLRPSRIFDPPQPVVIRLAEVPDGPPRRFSWRRKDYDVARAEGPERIAPEWWREDAFADARDYYRVEDVEGRRFWMFRTGGYGPDRPPPRWFLHGVFA